MGGVVGHEPARALQQVPICAEPGEPEIGQARLTRAEQLALAAELEVDLGELEAVRRLGQRGEARLPVGRGRLTQEVAVADRGAAAPAAAGRPGG